VSAPLAGLRVVELANYVTGPHAAAILADMGASVIKLEDPGAGDPFRGYGKGGYAPPFRSVNRGKRSLAIDLRSEGGKAIALELLDQADVFVENFRPGAVERLGLGWDVLRERNPKLVYCSISGFGSSGPYRNRPGYDTVGQAVSGLLGLLTDMDDPKPMGISLSDHITGEAACIAILGALVGRGISGQGRKVETSLLQATTSFLAENAARFFEEGGVPSRATRTHLAQAYAFVGGDGLPFVVHLSSPPKFWEGLTAAAQREELRGDPRFNDKAGRIKHYDALHATLQHTFRTAPRTHWLNALERNDVPAGPINRFDEVFADPGVQHLAMIQDVTHPTAGTMKLLGAGFSIEGHEEAEVAPPPLLGEHNDAILHELGRDDAEIARLRTEGVIK
jgi:crotonobetainyl-CoA:carnitine CoA-transferase CaiB-like acyl-CoA transferase